MHTLISMSSQSPFERVSASVSSALTGAPRTAASQSPFERVSASVFPLTQ